jgi:OOP family OmpA-OmpF porin
MKKSIVAIALLSSLVAASAVADPVDVGGRFFVNPNFGIYWSAESRNQDNGGLIGITGGYNLNNNIAVQAGISGISATDNGYFARAEGLYNFTYTSLPVVPYLAAGLGAVKVNDAGFALDGGAGVKYYLNDSVGVGIDYRHVWQLSDGTYNDNLLDVGIIWTFGGTNGLGAASQPQPLTASQQQAVTEAKQTLRYVLPQGVEFCGKNGATPQDGCITISGNQVTMHLDIKFEQNAATVNGRYAPAIIRLSKFLQTYPTTKATLYGYASSEGPAKFNQKLSLHRANQVKSYLVTKQHIGANRIKTVGMGIQNPIASNQTNSGRQKNRRVEAAVAVPIQVQK